MVRTTHGVDNTWHNTSPHSPHCPALNLVATTSPLTHMLPLEYCQYPTHTDTCTAHTHLHGHPHGAPSHARTSTQHTLMCMHKGMAHPHVHVHLHGTPPHAYTPTQHTPTCIH